MPKLRTALVAATIVLLAAATGRAGAYSIAPEAARVGESECQPGLECIVKQPSTPAWLAFVGSGVDLFQQTLQGIAANEYGTKTGADYSLYGTTNPYPDAPTPDQSATVGSTLVEFEPAQPGGGGSYAIVLHADRTLELLGPQRNGYPLAAQVTIPGTGALRGVVGLAAPTGTTIGNRIIVFTSQGVYDYLLTTEPKVALTLESSTPSTKLKGYSVPGNVDLSEDSNVTCRKYAYEEPTAYPCASNLEQPWELTLPSELLSVYQPPAGSDHVGRAPSTFAIAYPGSWSGASWNRTTQPPASYSISIFAYSAASNEPSGGLHLHLVDQIQAPFNSTSTKPLTVRYASSEQLIRVSTLMPNEKETAAVMTSWAEPGLAYNKPPATTGSLECGLEPGGGLPQLAVVAIAHPFLHFTLTGSNNETEEVTEAKLSSASVCATRLNALLGFRLQRTDGTETTRYSSQPLGETKLLSRTFNQETTTASPERYESAGGSPIVALSPSLDYPCDEYLRPFAEHPTLDGFPQASSHRYCTRLLAGAQLNYENEPFRPEHGAAGTVAVQLFYLEQQSGGAFNARVRSVALAEQPTSSTATTVVGTYDHLYETVSAPALTLLQLPASEIALTAHLLTNSEHQVEKTAASSSAEPVALLAAPPYYSNAEQQVTPTTITFSDAKCSGSSSKESNSAGIFGGFDGSFFDNFFELEVLAKVSASWTKETGLETCKSLEQQYMTGTFGNNFTAENSILFLITEGFRTYLDVTASSLGITVTNACSLSRREACQQIFTPTQSRYGLQTLAQLRDPQPNDIYAEQDHTLYADFGPSLEALLPRPGNPASYPPTEPLSTSETTQERIEKQPHNCAGPPEGEGSGNSGIANVNPFAAPPPPKAPNLLFAPQATEVNPATGGNEVGTSSTLETTEQSSETAAAEFSVGASISVKLGYAKFGAEYTHGWGTSITQSLQKGTKFSGGVNDFNGFFNPYEYRLYECRASLIGPGHLGVPVFLIDYMATQSADGLALNMVKPSLPEATQGQPYAGAVYASGGTPPYSYSLISGSLPPGLTFDETDGQVEGKPTTPGSYTFVIQARDKSGKSASQEETVTVAPEVHLASQLPEAVVGKRYEQSLGASGGVPPYTYLLTFGSLPPGLEIDNSMGVIRGTPTVAGKYCFKIYLTDSATPAGSIEQETCITVGSSLALLPATLPDATSGRPYSLTFAASGDLGSGYSFAAAESPECETGTICSATHPLPPGLELNAQSGELSGTPTASGRYGFEIVLTDTAHGELRRHYTLEVAESGSANHAARFESANAATFDVGQASAFTVRTSGSPASALTITGTLPAGISFVETQPGTATISGTPASGTAGVYPLTIKAQTGVEAAVEQAFTLTVDEVPEVTEEPTAITVAAGESASFKAAASGLPAPTVVWQLSTDGGTTWTDLEGSSSQTLAIASADPADNGNLYRAVFANSQGSATTEPARLTVKFAPEITLQPQPTAVATGAQASFSATAIAQPAPAAQWQVSTDGGATWTDIAGATSPTLKLPLVNAADNGSRYRVVFSNPLGSVTSEPAVLSVEVPPAITTQPAETTVVAGGEATLEATADGAPTPSVQWLESADGGTSWEEVKGATATKLRLLDVPAQADGREYEARFTNPVGTVTSQPAMLHVQTPPQITVQPLAATAGAGGSVSFTAAASGNPPPSVRWQVSTDGGITWAEIAGANAPTLALVAVGIDQNGYLYRAVFSNQAGSATSEAVKLTVTFTPTVELQPANIIVAKGSGATFTFKAAGYPPPAIQWQVSTDHGRSWVSIPGADSPTLTIAHVTLVDSGNLYRAMVVNASGTTFTAAAQLTVTAANPLFRGVCTAAPPAVVFLNHRLGRVLSYTVYVNGRKAREVHGKNLRSAKLPRLTAGWQMVRIVAITSRGFENITRRAYVECVRGLAVSRQLRRVHRRLIRAKRRRR